MKKRYAIVGMSHRALRLFVDSMLEQYREIAEIVAYVDIDQDRMDMMNRAKGTEIPTWLANRYEEMLTTVKPDCVIVTSTDATHHTYVVGALEHDIDVLCEKPLTTDAEKVRAILMAEKKSKGSVVVTFNYSLNASVPYEGYRLGMNGLNGRLETEHIGCRTGVQPPPGLRNNSINVMELFGSTMTVNPMGASGGHGGADPLMRDEIFLGTDPDDTLKRAAPLADGAFAVLTGIAMRESIASGQPVKIADLLGEEQAKDLLG